MDASPLSDRLQIFEIYRRYCEVTSEGLSFEGDGYRPVNESKKAKLYRDALSKLLQLVESSVDNRTSLLEEIPMLMSRLDLMADSCEFSRFYNFIFFILRENGQRSITVSRAIMAWKLVLCGRFRLLNQWCSFVEKNQRHNISEDTWRQVLAFSRCVHENLEGYDPEGAWPVLIDEFVEHMYRFNLYGLRIFFPFSYFSFWFCNFGITNIEFIPAHFHITGSNRVNGSKEARNFCCSCSDSETQLIDDSLPGIKIFPGVKRKYGDDLQDQEFINFNNTIIMNSKKRHTDVANNLVNRDGCLASNPMYNCNETIKHNYQCAVEGNLSKGFAELFSSLSSSQFDCETRVPYTL